MKKHNFLVRFLICTLMFSLISPAFCEDTTPAPYEDDEFPQGLKDLRRFEIISLGAMPFVTLDTTLVYSGIRYAQHDFAAEYKPNIFDKTSFNSDEQRNIILTSLGISLGIGLTDYIVQLVKRSKKKREKVINYDDIAITPISEDPDALKIDLPDSNETEQNVEILNNDKIPEVED